MRIQLFTQDLKEYRIEWSEDVFSIIYYIFFYTRFTMLLLLDPKMKELL
jgi:hypothetical protein